MEPLKGTGHVGRRLLRLIAAVARYKKLPTTISHRDLVEEQRRQLRKLEQWEKSGKS